MLQDPQLMKKPTASFNDLYIDEIMNLSKDSVKPREKDKSETNDDIFTIEIHLLRRRAGGALLLPA